MDVLCWTGLDCTVRLFVCEAERVGMERMCG